MDKTDIGKSGVKISSIGLGGGYWGREVDENTSFDSNEGCNIQSDSD